MRTFKVTWEFYKDRDHGRDLVGTASQDIQAEDYNGAWEIAHWLHSAYTNLHEYSNIIYNVNEVIWS